LPLESHLAIQRVSARAIDDSSTRSWASAKVGAEADADVGQSAEGLQDVGGGGVRGHEALSVV
jgi:hypothetical protein